MKKMPSMYQKVVSMIQAEGIQTTDRKQLEADLTRCYRISRADLPQIMAELDGYGVLKRKRQKIVMDI